MAVCCLGFSMFRALKQSMKWVCCERLQAYYKDFSNGFAREREDLKVTDDTQKKLVTKRMV